MKTGKDSGFSLVALMIGIAVLMILLGAAMPVWHTVVQRDREEELIFRGEQYVDAIIRFYGKHNRYPLSLRELAELDGQRSIRKLWTDPMMEDGRWILIFATHGGPPKVGAVGRGDVGGGLLSATGGVRGGAGGGLPGGQGPGITAPAGGDDPFGGGRSGNDPFAGGGGGSPGGGSLGGGRGTSPPDGGGNFPGGGFEGGGNLQGPGAGGLETPGGQAFTQPHGGHASGPSSTPAWSSPGSTFLHGSGPDNFGQASTFGQAGFAGGQQTHQSGRGSQRGGGGGGFSGGGGGGGFSGGGGGGFSGGGGGGFSGGGGGGFSGGGGGDYGRPGGHDTGLDDIFGQSGDLFGNSDGAMLNPYESLQGTEGEIQLNAQPIIGVRSRNPESSIREYNGQSTYDQWVFKVEQLPERRGGGRGAGNRNPVKRPGAGSPGAPNQGPPPGTGPGPGKPGDGDSGRDEKGGGKPGDKGGGKGSPGGPRAPGAGRAYQLPGGG